MRLGLMALITSVVMHSTTMAQSEGIKHGMSLDLSSVQSEVAGCTAVAMIQLAVDDVGGKALGKPIKVRAADHQPKADFSAANTRRWSATASWMD